ncbi:hypothetical protein D3870_18245 [Noviherbaspirillum cavernae]|uniref:Uncharacterized protein n=1 Tax=Noviherbaspirillum cavernae TaxID=2320862 RepID=A0A418X5B6_9BURK|nr:hypothetical protein D3870_18245 [Noviherbaspirillum cavernae]
MTGSGSSGFRRERLLNSGSGIRHQARERDTTGNVSIRHACTCTGPISISFIKFERTQVP